MGTIKFWKALAAACLAVIAVVVLTVPSRAAPPQPQVVDEGQIAGSGSVKLPSVATGNDRVYVAFGNQDNESANITERWEESGGWGSARLGSISGSSTYFNSAVTIGDDGTAHFAWISGGSRIYYRNKYVGGEWGNDRLIASGINFANGLSIAAQNKDNIFVTWRNAGGQISFVGSRNGGSDWTFGAGVPMSEPAYAGKPGLTAGPTGVFLIWTGAESGKIYVGQWNGDNFPNNRITELNNSFNPTIAVAPNGRVYAAWRHIERGVFYAERQNDGSWGVSNVFRHADVAGPVAISADDLNNVHLAWSSTRNGPREIFYSIKTPDEQFSEPIVVSRDNNGYKVNVDMATSVKSGYVLAHIAWESFVGGQYIRYARVRSNVGTPPTPVPPTATPVPPTATPIPQPQAQVSVQREFMTLIGQNGVDTTFNVDIRNVGGAADRLVLKVDNNIIYNGQYIPDQNGVMTVRVAAPPPADGCAETLVSAQLFGPGGTSFEAQTRVYVDSSVDGNILVRNPYGEGERVGGRQNVVPESFGPTQGGAAGFTRTDFFEIWSTSGSKECAGFKSMTVDFEKIPGSDVNPSPNEPEEIFVTGEIKQVVLPNPIPQGRYEFTVTIEDHAGNTRTFGLGTPLSITKDTTPPTVEVDGITTRVADGVATLSFDGLKVQDNFYPTADSQANAEYASTWILVKAAGEAPTEQDWLFNGVVRSGPIGDSLRWNMALGMVGQFKPNTDYQLYVRFLDGAANPSRQLQSGRIRLAELNVQRVYLPMLGHLGR